MHDEHILTLITRKLSGEASNEDLAELESLLQANPSLQYFEEILTSYWTASEKTMQDENKSFDAHFNYILQTAKDEGSESHQFNLWQKFIQHKRIWLSSCAAVAAIFIIIFSVNIFKTNNTKKTASSSNEKMVIVAKRGARTKIILPDGTMVWLNSGSTLTYNNAAFSNSIRSVNLDGEGFFDVVKDASHPFIVHTSKLDIKVLGTVFNVISYTDESTVETTLLRGLIEIQRKDIEKAPKIILHEHEKMILNEENEKAVIFSKPPASQKILHDTKQIDIVPVAEHVADSSLNETSWVYNKLIFDGDTFTQLAVKMERWFNIKIYFLNNDVANYRFSGIFENETFEEALQALQLTASFTYKIKGNEIYIDKK
jgi:ferric-dicitrate binding protein FerR (iron transport regulator)